MATKGDISDLSVLFYGGQPMVPLVEGFTRSRQSGVVRSDVAGGASRQRKKYFGTTHIASATFYLHSPAQMDYIQLFINNNEGKRWICHLAADRPLVEPYVVQALTDWNHVEVNALRGTVTVQLEIFSARDECLDETLGVLYPCIGDDICEYLELFGTMTEGWPLYTPIIIEQGVTLDFINQRYYKNQSLVSLGDVMTFTRASGGTDFVGGVLTEFGVNEPRVGDGGLLVEQSSINHLPNSYSPSAWSRTLNGTITEVVDGQSNAKTGRGVATGSGVFRLTSSQDNVINVLAGDTVFCTARFKITADCVFRVRVADPTFRGERGFDMVGSSVFGVLPFTTNLLSDGYVDVTVSYTATVSGQVFFEFYLIGVGGTTVSPPAGAICYMQIPQVEAPRKTSYIARTTDSGLRSAEFGRLSLTDFDTTEGTAFIEFYWDGESYNRGLFTLGDNTINHQVRCRTRSDSQIEVVLFDSGVNLGFVLFTIPTVGVVSVAVSYSLTSLIAAVNGITNITTPSGGVTSINQMSIGSRHGGAEPLNGHIRRTWYRPRAFTEQELIEVTS